jgi:hypothetical protein
MQKRDGHLAFDRVPSAIGAGHNYLDTHPLANLVFRKIGHARSVACVAIKPRETGIFKK